MKILILIEAFDGYGPKSPVAAPTRLVPTLINACEAAPFREIAEQALSEYLARTVGHTKTRAEMFGKKHHGIPILRRILLGEILHGLNQHPLPFNIAGIGSFLSAAATTGWIGQYGNGKNLGHDKNSQLHYSDAIGWRYVVNCSGATVWMKGISNNSGFSWVGLLAHHHHLGFWSGLEMEKVLGRLGVDGNIRIMGQTIISRRLK